MSTRTYDALNRETNDSIARATGVIGTTAQSYEFDGRGRMTRATDNGDPSDSSQSSVATNNYDSIDRVLEEGLQIGSTGTERYVTSSAWESDHNRTGLTYPNGRVVESTFDNLDRLKTLKDQGVATPIATWRHIGPDRVLEMAYQNGLVLTHLNDARTASANQPGMPSGQLRGFDGLQRMTAHRWLEANLDSAGYVTSYVSTTSTVGFQHAYDAANNKLSEARLHDSGNSEAYDYDSAYRLNEFDRGTLNSSLTEVTTPTTTPGLLQAQDWTLDGPGNWPSNVTTTGGTPTTENRTHNNLNQITAVGPTALQYDANGNLTDDGTYTYAWDAKNRLRKVTRKSDSVVIGTYSYDALGRRVLRVFIVGADPAKTVNYYLDGQRVIEERELSGGSEPLARQYTYGLYIDEALSLDRDLNANGVATDTGERLFYHANSLYSVFGLSDQNRIFPERYLYDAYGRPIVWLPGPDTIYGTADDVCNVDGSSTVQNVRLFTGRESDVESVLHYYRARYHSPRLGRFLSRDPVVALNRGTAGIRDLNLYEFVRNNPVARLDPSGLKSFPGGGKISIDSSCAGKAFVVPREKDSVWVLCYPEKICEADGVFLGKDPSPDGKKTCASGFFKVIDGCTAIVRCMDDADKTPYISEVRCVWPFGIRQRCTGGCGPIIGREAEKVYDFPEGFDPTDGPLDYPDDVPPPPKPPLPPSIPPIELPPKEYDISDDF